MRRNIFYWSLYDFANSIIMIAFLFYFSQWLVIDQGRPAWWYNGALVASSLLFVIMAPFLSKRIDVSGEKIAGLRLWTVLTFFGLGTLSLITLFSDALDVPAAILYALSLFAYLVSFLYFTPMLNDLSTGENRGRISGWGQGANLLGQVSGLLITLPFASGAIFLFGEPGRAQTLLPAVLFFGLLVLPMLFLYKDAGGVYTASEQTYPRNPLAVFRALYACTPLALLLAGYFFFSDALLTFANNFPLYLEQVHRVSDTTKSLLTIAILALGAIGSVALGHIADRKGNGRVLVWILVGWVLLMPAMALIPSFNALIPIFLLAGILFGPIWGVSRAMVGQIAPPHLIASSYGYYTVLERFATFAGPLVWSGVLLTVGETSDGYRVALLAMAALVFIGLLFTAKIRAQLL